MSRKYFKTGQLVPCYTEEGRCKWCRGRLGVCSLALIGVYPNMWALADEILEPTRLRYGKPIRVLRGFLCRTKLKAYGLSEEYLSGECVDICAYIGQPRRRKVSRSKFDATRRVSGFRFQVSNGQPDVTREENMKIAEIIKGMDFDQLVIYPDYLHVSYKRNGDNRHEVISKI